jgi:hypothetical protein
MASSAGAELRGFILRTEVLHLYRRLLRTAKGAPDPAARGAGGGAVPLRWEFRASAGCTSPPTRDLRRGLDAASLAAAVLVVGGLPDTAPPTAACTPARPASPCSRAAARGAAAV